MKTNDKINRRRFHKAVVASVASFSALQTAASYGRTIGANAMLHYEYRAP